MITVRKLSRSLLVAVAAGPALVMGCEFAGRDVSAPDVAIVALVVTPDSAGLDPLQSLQFTAFGRTAADDSVPVAVRWSATAGTITRSGLYTADTSEDAGTVTATLVDGALSTTSRVSKSRVVKVVLLPEAVTLAPGGAHQFTTLGIRNTGDTVTPWVTFAATGGTITGTGLFTAGALTGEYRVIASARKGALADTAAVTVKLVPVGSVTVSPSTANVSVGGAVQLAATLRDSAGYVLGGRPVTWSSDNASVATVSASGLVTGLSAGAATVTATSEGKSGTAAVTVTAPPPPDGTVGTSLPPRLAQSTGQTFYVAPGGTDANPGSAAAPWRTLQHAMDALRPGERALVRAGTYETGGAFGTDADTYSWRAACTAAAPCTIAAYPGERPVIHGMLRISGSYLRLAGFIIEGPLSRDVTSASERRANQIDLSDAHHVELAGNEIRYNDYHAGITAYRVHDVHILGNWIHDNGRFTIAQDPQTGSSTWNVDHGVYWGSTSGGGNLIANNLIEHNRGNGLQLYPNTMDVIVTGNTIVHNGNTGIYVGGSADRITVVNNIAAFNDRNAQMRIRSGTANVVRGNLVYSPTDAFSGIENTTGVSVADNWSADPLFANRASSDFRLAVSSPALDRALAAYALAVDYLGGARPRGRGVDLGAFEQ